MNGSLDPREPAPPGGPVPAAERRRRRRDWRIAAGVFLGLIATAALEQQLLALSRSLPVGSDVVFLVLVHVNVIGIGLLVFLLGRNVVKLVVERRRGMLGSRLTTKFAVAFVFVAVVSTSALFVFSAFLVSHAVNAWFEIELSESLEDSVELADTYYADQGERTLFFGRSLAREIQQGGLLAPGARDALETLVARRQREYGLGQVEVLGRDGSTLARATRPELAGSIQDPPSAGALEAVRAGGSPGVVEAAASGGLVRGLVPVRARGDAGRAAAVVAVGQLLPEGLDARVAGIRAALESYRRIQPGEGTFEASLLMLLAMIALSILLFSSWIAFRLAKQVTVPIQRLLGATAQMGAGNLDVHVEPGGDDEIGLLVSGFNRMAHEVRRGREDLEGRRRHMEVVLSSIGAGVISLDPDGAVTTLNRAAMRLLGVAAGDWLGKPLADLIHGPAFATVTELLRRLASGPHEMLRRQAPLEVAGEVRAFNWTVSRIHGTDREGTAGYVVVATDITHILRVQRMAAWRELARRIAHEIKNPLTPIQLAAQRLRRKLDGRLEDPEAQELLVQCTDAITSQVQAMKTLVTEFSNFAKLPATDPVPTNLNTLIEDAVAMYRGRQSIAFETELDPALPELDLDREQIKRVLLNLIDNAMAAVDRAGPGPREIRVSTRLIGAVDSVHLEVADTGTGIRPEDRGRIFEPYFSTKREGSGLGLAIVSRIVSDHSGYVRVRANRPRGARFTVELPVRT